MKVKNTWIGHSENNSDFSDSQGLLSFNFFQQIRWNDWRTFRKYSWEVRDMGDVCLLMDILRFRLGQWMNRRGFVGSCEKSCGRVLLGIGAHRAQVVNDVFGIILKHENCKLSSRKTISNLFPIKDWCRILGPTLFTNPLSTLTNI